RWRRQEPAQELARVLGLRTDRQVGVEQEHQRATVGRLTSGYEGRSLHPPQRLGHGWGDAGEELCVSAGEWRCGRGAPQVEKRPAAKAIPEDHRSDIY